MKPSDFRHPEDTAALQQLETIHGFAVLMKKILSIGLECIQHGINISSSIRLSEKQLLQIQHQYANVWKHSHLKSS